MLEMMFAAAVVALALPFAYRRIADSGEGIKNAAIAKSLIGEAETVANYLRLNARLLVEDELVEIETEDEDRRIYAMRSRDGAVGFIVATTWESDILRAHKIAAMIGIDAAVAEEDGAAYSATGGWSVKIEGLVPGDLVRRIVMSRMNDDTSKYLHRTVLSEGELSTMKRDMSMGGHSIAGIYDIAGSKLSAAGLDAYLVAAPVVSAGSLYFTNGLNLNPDRSHIPLVRAIGDAVGFRNIWTDSFQGGGAMTAERATITKKLVVNNTFEAKSSYARTASGFAGLSAGNIRCAYLDAAELTFLSPFGLTVSSESLYSATPPVKIGGWSFPNSSGAGPRFSELRLFNFGDRNVTIPVSDFSEITKAGWR